MFMHHEWRSSVHILLAVQCKSSCMLKNFSWVILIQTGHEMLTWHPFTARCLKKGHLLYSMFLLHLLYQYFWLTLQQNLLMCFRLQATALKVMADKSTQSRERYWNPDFQPLIYSNVNEELLKLFWFKARPSYTMSQDMGCSHIKPEVAQGQWCVYTHRGTRTAASHSRFSPLKTHTFFHRLCDEEGLHWVKELRHAV